MLRHIPARLSGNLAPLNHTQRLIQPLKLAISVYSTVQVEAYNYLSTTFPRSRFQHSRITRQP